MINYRELNFTDTDILCALYNYAKPSFIRIVEVVLTGSGHMTEKEALSLLNETREFKMLWGRKLFVKLEDGWFDETLYNKKNGENAANLAIEEYIDLKNKYGVGV